MPKHLDKGFHPGAVSVRESEMLVATAEFSDELLDSAVSETGSIQIRQQSWTLCIW